MHFIIQVAKNDMAVKAQLLQKLSEGKTANPRWLVTFLDEHSWKDEELYEAVFGKHWSKDLDEQSKTSRNHSRSQNTGMSNGTRKKSNKSSSAGMAASNVSTISSSPTSDAEVSQTSSSTNKKKSVSFIESSLRNNEVVAPSRDEHRSSPRSSTREQRSKRRQSHVMEKVEIKSLSKAPPNHKRPALTSSRSGSDSKKVRRDEEVVKIPMRTGTLYLYRGLVRRAEFIRHI
jgi:hypothetical protein